MANLRLIFLILLKYIRRNLTVLSLLAFFLSSLVFILVNYGLLNVKDNISEGFIGTYQLHDLPLEVTGMVSKGLVGVDASGKVLPQLAQSWKANKDATSFTFKLKKGLRWSDNTLIKSSDLDFNIADVRVSFPNESEVTFKLKDSYSPFPTLLTKPLFKKGTLIGAGPYEIKKVEKSRIFITKITLTSKEKGLPDVTVRFYPNEKTALTGFELGEVQTLSQVSNYEHLLNNPKIKLLQKTDYGKVITILFNTKDPLLVSKPIRQALSFITPVLDNETVANNPFSVFSWAYDAQAKKYLSNKESALGALEKAKSQASKESLDKEITLTSTPNLEEKGKEVVEAWKSLGLKVKLRIEPGLPQNFQSLLIAQSIPIDPDQYFLWHSTQEKTNLSKYSSYCCPLSARVDKDLEDGRKMIDQDERRVKYFDFQKTLLEDAPAIFLYYPKYNILYLRKAQENLLKILPFQLGPQYQ